MSKHTEGPWERDSKKNIYIVGDINKKENNATYICEMDALNTEWEANAKLIANAPELLKVCKGLVERIDINGGLGDYKGGQAFIMGQARCVIAEAEGR